MSPVVVLRPEPGNAATIARLRAAGLGAVAQPVFAARALAWLPPDPAGYDALLATSAQAPRLAGKGLAALAHLPAVAVGEATAVAARAAGLTVAVTGSGDATAAIAQARARGFARLLHLAGRDRTASTAGVATVAVYESVQVRVPAIEPGATVLLHSARAAEALAAAPVPRDTVMLVAISPPVLAAAGQGWRAGVAAERPDDASIIAAVRALDPRAHTGG